MTPLRIHEEDYPENHGPPPWLAWTLVALAVLVIGAILWFVG